MYEPFFYLNRDIFRMIFKNKGLIATLVFSILSMDAGWTQILNLPGTLNKPIRQTQTYAAITGSPYLIESFEKGQLLDKMGNVYDAFIKYDTYSDEVEVLNKNVTLIINKSLYSGFILDFIDAKETHQSLKFKKDFDIPGILKNKFYQVLHEEEKFMLLKSVKTILVKNDDAGYAGQTVPDRFETKESYYVHIKNGNTKKLELNRKSLNNLDNEGIIKNYLKTNKLKVNSEANLIELFKNLESDGILERL